MSKKKLFFFVAIVTLILSVTFIIKTLRIKNISNFLKIYNAIETTFTSDIIQTKSHLLLSNLVIPTDALNLTDHQRNTIQEFIEHTSYTIETITDRVNKKAQLNITICFNEERSTTFITYFDSDRIAVYFPDINNRVVYLNWDDMDQFISSDLPIKQYIDSLLSLEWDPFLKADGIEAIYQVLNTSLTILEEKNQTLLRQSGKQKGAVKYTLDQESNLDQMIQDILYHIYQNPELLHGLATVFQDIYSIQHNTQLKTVLVENKEVILDKARSSFASNKIGDLSLYLHKNKLSRMTYHNIWMLPISDKEITIDSSITTDFYQIKKDYDWMQLNEKSINLASFDTKGLEDFQSKLFLSVYSLCLQYPELLEVLSAFVSYQ